MAYLTEQLTRQKSVPVVAPGSLHTDNATTSLANRPANDSENDNFQIARDLSERKARLIKALSQFPFTAQWLLDEYEKAAVDTDADSLVSDVASALTEIRSLFSALHTDRRSATAVERTNLSAELERFPYSFKDLSTLSEIIFQVCEWRELCTAPTLGTKNAIDPLSKRVIYHQRRRSDNRLASSYQALMRNQWDVEFLFLSAKQMHSHATEMAIAERLWLDSRKALAEANTKLVMFIANQYKSTFLDFEDLVQEGQTGLLKAVDKFDHQLGFQFSTYAGYWIRQAISRSLSRGERLVRIPCGQVANINKVYRTKNELSARSGQDPSVYELANETKLSVDEINTIMTISQSTLSLEGPEDDDEAFAPIDFLEQQVFTHCFKTIAENELRELLAKAISGLNPREANVIRAHFGIDVDQERTLQEIGTELSLTRERVRQIQVTALKKMRLDLGEQLSCFL